jgi:tetratricopeptide (TPR) repeat protein
LVRKGIPKRTSGRKITKSAALISKTSPLFFTKRQQTMDRNDDPLMRELSSMSFSAIPARSTRNVFDNSGGIGGQTGGGSNGNTGRKNTTPSFNSSNNKKQYSSPSSPSASPTPPSKTCMVLPHFGGGGFSGKKKNKRRGRIRVSPSAASTADQSSTADPFQLEYNDQTSLLKNSSSNRPSMDGEGATGNGNWYLETMPEASAADEEEHEEPSASMLLSFPTPQDRSHGARRHQSQELGHMHAYDGELEPEGVRGQEAKVKRREKQQNTGNDYNAIPLRSFDSASLTQGKSQRQMQLRDRIQSTSRRSMSNSPHHGNDDQQQRAVVLNDGEFNSYGNEGANDRSRRGNSHRASTESNNDEEYQQMLQNNIAEIVQQQHEEEEVGRERSGSSHHRRRDGNDGTTDTADPFGSPAHAPSSSLSASRGDEGTTTPTVNRSRDASEKDPTSPESRLSNRKSAPVDVDEGSFQDPLTHVQGIHAMAMEHVMRGEYDMALQAFSEVLRVYLKQHGKAHPLTASAYHNLGTVHTKRAGLLLDHTLHQRHCREQALLCFQAAARAARDSPQLGPNHPNVAVSLVRIGFLLLQSRQYQNAVITFEEALRIRLDHYGPTHGLVANLYNNLGVCNMHLCEFSKGRRYLQQALDIQKELLSQEDNSETALLELADTLCNIGGLNLEWIRQQGPDARHALDAESAFLEALELRSEVLGQEHPLTNQVRSLHDMVRSIPLPKVNSIPATPGTAGSTAGITSNVPYSHEYSGDEVSAMTLGTASMPTTPRSSRSQSPNTRRMMQKYTGTLMPPPTPSTVDGINLPSLDRSVDRSNSADNILSPRSPDPIAGASTRGTIEAYDVTEESCLLRRPGKDMSSQVGLVVTYAEVATAMSGNSSGVETARTSTMNQAKAILDAHRDFMDSPNGLPPTGPHANAVNASSNEDGLIPLAGNWPEPAYQRISPEVLENPSEYLNTIQNCASNFMRRGRYNEAIHLLEIVVECQKTRNGPVHQDVGDALHNVGIAQLRAQEYYKALQAFEEAVRVRKGALGRDHAQVAISLVKVGISLLLLQRLEDSLWIFREALTVRKNALGSLHPSNARIWNNIGCVHVEFNELKEARRSFEAALDIQRNALVNDPENGPIMFGASTTLQNLGYLYAKRDMHEKAAMVLRESLTVR